MWHKYIFLLLACCISSFLSSCFTGVESTKRISLTKEDRKLIKPSPEDLLLAEVKPSFLADWKKGKEFFVADNKAALIFDQEGIPDDPLSLNMKGKILSFDGTEIRKRPDGRDDMYLVFHSDDMTFRYNSGKSALNAPHSISSSSIPMLIDKEMIQQTAQILVGRRIWTRTALWYDNEENKVPGRKFVPVDVRSVSAGNMVFPLNIGFVDDNGHEAHLLINFGNTPTESRSFSNIFCLNDIRKKYPSISDETWQLICNEKIARGMTKEECRLALGNPSDLSAGHDYSQTLDLWHYPDGTVLWFEDGLLTRFRK